MMAMTDGWIRIGTTAVQKGPWTVAKVSINGLTSYECRREDLKVLARCGSFDQAKKFTAEYDKRMRG
jgi:hypothetical protein